jgi:hypothetical protein
VLLYRLSWLQDKPICQEADDLGNLVPWKGETHWTELWMMKRQQGTCGRKRLDMPLGVGNGADGDFVGLKIRAWLPLHHSASCITKFANQLIRRQDEPLW